MGKKGPLWWRESDWLLKGSSAANQILLHHSGPILSALCGDLLPKVLVDYLVYAEGSFQVGTAEPNEPTQVRFFAHHQTC